MKKKINAICLAIVTTSALVCGGCGNASTQQQSSEESQVKEAKEDVAEAISEEPTDAEQEAVPENGLELVYNENGNIVVTNKMVEDILYSQSEERLNKAHVDVTCKITKDGEKIPMTVRMDPIGTKYKFADEEGEFVVRDKESNDVLFIGRLFHKEDVERVVFNDLLALWYPISEDSRYFLSEGNVNGNDMLLFLRSKEELENGAEADFLVVHISETDYYVYFNPLGDVLTTIDIMGRMQLFIGEEPPEKNFDMSIVDESNWELFLKKDTAFQDMFLNLK